TGQASLDPLTIQRTKGADGVGEHAAEDFEWRARAEIGNLALGVLGAAAEDDGGGGESLARRGPERELAPPERALAVHASHAVEAPRRHHDAIGGQVGLE